MDPRHTGEMFRHLEKQNEHLMDAYRSMSHELHKLQVEEEMLMRKFYELMSAQGLSKKNEEKSSTVPVDGNNGLSRALIHVSSNEPNGQFSGALFLASSNGPNGQSSNLILPSSNEHNCPDSGAFVQES